MLKHVFLLASLVAASLLAPAATSASAQPVITAPEQLWAIECGGQYECVPTCCSPSSKPGDVSDTHTPRRPSPAGASR
jgi:opacity protein-like surface antigen